mmetsp:Transcript_153456/g.286019  ORF Transcript_153456/g.286019 Transcript_153456/m.286019 type:complete len:213 (-) Transcript_153456:1127-1765(-)
MRVADFTWMSCTTLPLGPLIQPTNCVSTRNSCLWPRGKSSISPDESIAFITSETTSPKAIFFCGTGPRICATLYPRSLFVWSTSTTAPLRVSISRIIAPRFPLSQPTQELGMRTMSHSPVSDGSLTARAWVVVDAGMASAGAGACGTATLPGEEFAFAAAVSRVVNSCSGFCEAWPLLMAALSVSFNAPTILTALSTPVRESDGMPFVDAVA